MSKDSLDGKPCIYAKNYLPSHKVKIIQRQSSQNCNTSKGIFLRCLLLDCLVQLGERKAALELRYLLHEVTVCSAPSGNEPLPGTVAKWSPFLVSWWPNHVAEQAARENKTFYRGPYIFDAHSQQFLLFQQEWEYDQVWKRGFKNFWRVKKSEVRHLVGVIGGVVWFGFLVFFLNKRKIANTIISSQEQLLTHINWLFPCF